ncbi:LOW QUALITY PROTEIN: hypothetical protein RJ641_000161 [Dillenia turbinata]|uniref:Uncharacterized protein n=1 Tax=Dillenia turbinata TaxID=194707 RepID=A0AAN8W5M7_9MAGN
MGVYKRANDPLDDGSTAVVDGGSRDVALQNVGSNTTIDAGDKHIDLKKSSGGMSNAVNGLSSDDLESVLRQRTFENLRSGVQASARSPYNQKDNSDAEVASPQTKSDEEAAASHRYNQNNRKKCRSWQKFYTRGVNSIITA